MSPSPLLRPRYACCYVYVTMDTASDSSGRIEDVITAMMCCPLCGTAEPGRPAVRIISGPLPCWALECTFCGLKYQADSQTLGVAIMRPDKDGRPGLRAAWAMAIMGRWHPSDCSQG